jgi:hypothetical protein
MKPKVATGRFRPGLDGPVGRDEQGVWQPAAACLRRDLYVEPTSETQPSWPFRFVAAVSSFGGDAILFWR